MATRVAKSNRQKYNFLAALVSQLDQATEEKDELRDQFAEASGIADMQQTLLGVMKQYDDLNQWVARLELALEELDSDGSESVGEEPESYDDGDDDADVPWDEPEVGSPREGHGRVASPVDDPGRRQEQRRGVSEHRRSSRVRAQPELRKVKCGPK